ncbi:hypothetical protein RUM44_007767 [Polyplax serrata]|uniref:G-protein coupled receptors family 1 profile domain-containing protein n=1 Tax=Polyplax serrata TaxID=468196 RepID=A0ABR1B772_POLSC
MDELNNQLLAIINSQQGYPVNLSDDYPNLNGDLYGDFPRNMSSWEELQSIIQYHYNKSIHSSNQRNIDQDCHPFGNMFDAIYSYYLPSMIFLGLVGNLLSCIVFLNTHLKMRSSSYYLAALACADFGFLAALFLVWLNGTLEIPVFNIEGYCQCIVYVSSVCSFLSVWLIAAFTVERFIAVQYPLHRPHLCTVARAKAIVFYLVCISLTVHTYVFVTSGIIKLEDGLEVCEMVEGYREVMRIINIIDSVLTLIAPLVLIVVMNAMIIYNLVKFSKMFKRPGGVESEMMGSRRSDMNLEVLGSINKLNSSGSSRRNLFQGTFNTSRNSSSFRRLQQFKFPSKCDGSNSSEFPVKEGRPAKQSHTLKDSLVEFHSLAKKQIAVAEERECRVECLLDLLKPSFGKLQSISQSLTQSIALILFMYLENFRNQLGQEADFDEIAAQHHQNASSHLFRFRPTQPSQLRHSTLCFHIFFHLGRVTAGSSLVPTADVHDPLLHKFQHKLHTLLDVRHHLSPVSLATGPEKS